MRNYVVVEGLDIGGNFSLDPSHVFGVPPRLLEISLAGWAAPDRIGKAACRVTLLLTWHYHIMRSPGRHANMTSNQTCENYFLKGRLAKNTARISIKVAMDAF